MHKKIISVLIFLIPFLLTALPIHDAAKRGNVKEVQRELDGGADINAKGKDGNTPLHFAALAGKSDLTEFLIKKGADLRVQNDRGETALFLAVESGDTESVRFMLQRGSSIAATTYTKETPLHYAAQSGDTEVAEILLNANANVKAKNLDGLTPYDVAVQKKYTEVAGLLSEAGEGKKIHIFNYAATGNIAALRKEFDSGELLSARDNQGNTLLHYAAKNGKTNVVEYLIDQNIKINEVNRAGYSALHEAAKSGHADVVEILLNDGAWKDQQSYAKETPLHLAASSGHVKVINILLEKGADINALSEEDEYPVFLAAENGKSEAFALLVEKGAKLYIPGQKAGRSIHSVKSDQSKIQPILRSLEEQYNGKMLAAAARGDTGEIQRALENGANPSAVDSGGNTILHLAIANGHDNVLKAYHYDWDLRNKKNNLGNTPLHVAAAHNQVGAARILVNKSSANVRNENGETPADVARREGNLKLASYLDDGYKLDEEKQKQVISRSSPYLATKIYYDFSLSSMRAGNPYIDDAFADDSDYYSYSFGFDAHSTPASESLWRTHLVPMGFLYTATSRNSTRDNLDDPKYYFLYRSYILYWGIGITKLIPVLNTYNFWAITYEIGPVFRWAKYKNIYGTQGKEYHQGLYQGIVWNLPIWGSESDDGENFGGANFRVAARYYRVPGPSDQSGEWIYSIGVALGGGGFNID